MTMRNTLLSGIAGLAIAGVLSFGAYAQLAPPQTSNPGQTPATAPSADVPGTARNVHHRTYHGQSGPQYSTPAEHAATDRLNQQQVVIATSSAPTMTPTDQPTDSAQPATPPPTQ